MSTRIREYPAGTTPRRATPGDFFLTEEAEFGSHRVQRMLAAVASKFVHVGGHIWFGDDDCARWAHAGMVVEPNGAIIEANPRGVGKTHLSKYHDKNIAVIHPDVTDEQRHLAVQAAYAQLGRPYDFLKLLALVINGICGFSLTAGLDHHDICSELVARCTEKYIVGYDSNIPNVSPPAIAKEWNVQSSQPAPTHNIIDSAIETLSLIRKVMHI